MNKFEQLIEFVINDEENKAKELFHEIVVEKSRQIYENLMKDTEVEEAALGGDSADALIDDVTADETGISMEDDEKHDNEPAMNGDDVEDMDSNDVEDMDMDSNAADAAMEPAELEDRVVDLEDKLDELMAEFESMMNDGEESNENDVEVDAMDDNGDVADMDMNVMAEAVSLKAAPKPVTSEEGGVNKKSAVAANAGAKGPIGNSVKPVQSDTATEKGRPAPKVEDQGGTTSPKQGPATKAHTAQATGVNTKSPVPKG